MVALTAFEAREAGRPTTREGRRTTPARAVGPLGSLLVRRQHVTEPEAYAVEEPYAQARDTSRARSGRLCGPARAHRELRDVSQAGVLPQQAGAHAATSRVRAATGATGSTGFLRGRPRGRLRATTTPPMNSSPPQTPQGSRRSSAPARHSLRIGQSTHSAFAVSTSAGDSAKNSSGSASRQGRSASATPPGEVTSAASPAVKLMSAFLACGACAPGGRETRRP